MVLSVRPTGLLGTVLFSDWLSRKVFIALQKAASPRRTRKMSPGFRVGGFPPARLIFRKAAVFHPLHFLKTEESSAALAMGLAVVYSDPVAFLANHGSIPVCAPAMHPIRQSQRQPNHDHFAECVWNKLRHRQNHSPKAPALPERRGENHIEQSRPRRQRRQDSETAPLSFPLKFFGICLFAPHGTETGSAALLNLPVLPSTSEV